MRWWRRCRPCPCTFLTVNKEKRLVQYIVDMVDMGLGLACDGIRSTVYKIAEACHGHPFTNEMAGLKCSSLGS